MKFTRSLSSSSFCHSQNDSFESNNNEKNTGSEDEMDYIPISNSNWIQSTTN